MVVWEKNVGVWEKNKGGLGKEYLLRYLKISKISWISVLRYLERFKIS